LQQIVGGSIGEMVEVVTPLQLPQSPTVVLRYERIERILGVDVPKAKVTSILQGLGFVLLNENSPWHFRVPTFRFDVEQEIDLIEEVARVFGYQNIPNASLSKGAAMSLPEPNLERAQVLLAALNSMGYSEAITYSFVEPEWQAKILASQTAPVVLKNPIAKDLSVMRQSCLPGLLKAMQFNRNRQQRRVRLAEVGKVFIQDGATLQQPCQLAMLAVGPVSAQHWSNSKEAETDFFAVKGDVETLLTLVPTEQAFSWQRCEHELLHPGQSVALYHGEHPVGMLGSLHPKWVAELGMQSVPVLFEMDLDKIGSHSVPQFVPVARFPVVKRDLSIVIDEGISANDLILAVKQISDNLLNNVEIFDVYTGEGIDFSKKSVALGLTFLDPSRTLIDSEVDQAVQAIIVGLKNQLNATMRA
jgi:phenylalanyl-tRNA synthetase beta chain